MHERHPYHTITPTHAMAYGVSPSLSPCRLALRLDAAWTCAAWLCAGSQQGVSQDPSAPISNRIWYCMCLLLVFVFLFDFPITAPDMHAGEGIYGICRGLVTGLDEKCKESGPTRARLRKRAALQECRTSFHLYAGIHSVPSRFYAEASRSLFSCPFTPLA